MKHTSILRDKGLLSQYHESWKYLTWLYSKTTRKPQSVSSNVAFGPKRVKQLGLYSAAKAAREVLIQTMVTRLF